MVYYRLYHLRGSKFEVESFDEFEAEDDRKAIVEADARRGVKPMELWSGHRKVMRWDGLIPASGTTERN